MQVLSNRASIERRETTALALFECLCLTSLFGGYAYLYNTLSHVAYGACIAPFMLLRIEMSNRLGLTWARAFYDKIESFNEWHNDLLSSQKADVVHRLARWMLYLSILPLFALVPFIGAPIFLVIRVLSIVYSAMRNPLDSISAIPRNWRLHVFCVDFSTPPEVVPGVDSEPDESPLASLKFSNMWKEESVFGMFGATIVAICWYSSSLLFRFSVKGTSAVWLPLVWCLSAPQASASIYDKLRDMRDDDMQRLSRVLAAFWLVLFIGKVAILVTWHVSWSSIRAIWTTLPGNTVLTAYVQPADLPLWQVASAVNSVLAWWLYLLARRYLRYQKEGRLVDERVVAGELKRWTHLRCLLSWYSGICVVYITAVMAWQLGARGLPVRFIVFPWF